MSYSISAPRTPFRNSAPYPRPYEPKSLGAHHVGIDTSIRPGSHLLTWMAVRTTILLRQRWSYQGRFEWVTASSLVFLGGPWGLALRRALRRKTSSGAPLAVAMPSPPLRELEETAVRPGPRSIRVHDTVRYVSSSIRYRERDDGPKGGQAMCSRSAPVRSCVCPPTLKGLVRRRMVVWPFMRICPVPLSPPCL